MTGFGPSETLGELHGENKATSDSLLEILAVFAIWLPSPNFERRLIIKRN
jgi:hypothetical protein